MPNKTSSEITSTQLVLRRAYEQKIREAREDYEQKTADFNEQIKNDVAAYNEVVSNTLRKFVSDLDLWGQLTTQLVISHKAEFKDFDIYTGEYLFETNGKFQRIHPLLFKNDPVIVAMYTRRKIREFQDVRREENYKLAKKNSESAKKALALKQKEADAARRTMDALEANIAKHNARKELRKKSA